ncbi:MAG: hypothetical protein Q7S55_05070 [Nanoarchaeota archaeon]|nr:hypothetical protein [Nanoarchaeota archaeon]
MKFEDFLEWIKPIGFILFFVILSYPLYLIYKHELNTISDYLGTKNVGAMLVIITGIYVIVLIWKHYITKIDIFKDVNHYALFSIYLVALSITFSIFTATSLIQKNQEFFFKEDLGITRVPEELKKIVGKIECKSDFYIMPVKDDNLNCDVFIENKDNTLILKEFSIQTGESLQYNNYKINKEQKLRTKITIQLPNSRDYTIFWSLGTNSTYYSNGNKGLKLEEPSVAIAEKNERQRVIYLILTSAISLSILGIFTGMNNFRQIWQNGKNSNHK